MHPYLRRSTRTLHTPTVPHVYAVICTLGPSCRDVETLVELLEAGMTAARIDLTVSTPHSLLPLAHGVALCLFYACAMHIYLYPPRMDVLYVHVRLFWPA